MTVSPTKVQFHDLSCQAVRHTAYLNSCSGHAKRNCP